VQGNTKASSQGVSTTQTAINVGQFGALAFGTPQNITAGPMQGADGPNQNALPAGTGKSFGEGSAVGSGSGFVLSGFGTSFAAGTSGGNSTSSSDLTVLSANELFNETGDFANDAAANALLGGGLSGGTLSANGVGGGRAGGTGSFGGSLPVAIAAATPGPPVPAPASAPAPASSSSGKKSKKSNNTPASTPVPAAPVPAPPAPAFSFFKGQNTGGGGGGEATGGGNTFGLIASPGNINLLTGQNATGNTNFFVDEAYGSALSNGFGFGVGSGSGTNAGNEYAGGSGGASALGQGGFKFELDDTQGAGFNNGGNTNSMGSGGAFVGANIPGPTLFGATKPVGQMMP
jgi:hypothetical protein